MDHDDGQQHRKPQGFERGAGRLADVRRFRPHRDDPQRAVRADIVNHGVHRMRQLQRIGAGVLDDLEAKRCCAVQCDARSRHAASLRPKTHRYDLRDAGQSLQARDQLAQGERIRR